MISRHVLLNTPWAPHQNPFINLKPEYKIPLKLSCFSGRPRENPKPLHFLVLLRSPASMAAMATASLGEDKAKEVIRQVEFYFSDSNLPRDRFLKKTVEENEDGLVSLALVCSFARMRNHLNLGNVKPEEVKEETVQAVAAALRESAFLKVSEDGKRVGRSSELLKPEEVIEQVDSRTVAASPLPYDVKLEDVEAFFSKQGKVNSVRLPRLISDKRHFCGSALIEFSVDEDAKKVLGESLVYAGTLLEIIPKKQFDNERQKMRNGLEQTGSFSKDGSIDCYPRGLIVGFKLKRTSSEEYAQDNVQTKCNDSTDVPESEVATSTTTATEEGEENTETPSEVFEKKAEKEGDIQEGDNKPPNDSSIENVDEAKKGLSGDSEKDASCVDEKIKVTREDLKQVFQRFGTVKFVDYRMGEESGYIRFEDPDAAVQARATAVLVDGGLIVKNCLATLEALTGEAEKEYWSLLRGNQERYRDNKGGRGRGRGNKGGRHFNGKRSHSNDAARPNKAQKS